MSDDENESGVKLRAPPDFAGPTQERNCTDFLFVILLYAMWTAMTGLGIYSVRNGDYRVVLYPMDYDGNICGTNYGPIDMTDYKYLYYVNYYSGGVCVNKCPEMRDISADPYTLVSYGGIYQVDGKSSVPENFIEVANYTSSDDVMYCTKQNCYPNDNPVQSYESEGVNEGYGYAYYAVDSKSYLYRCFLKEDGVDLIKSTTKANQTDPESAVEDTENFWTHFYGDLWTARAYVLGFGFCLAVVLGFLYAFVLRLPGVLEFMVWGSILAVITMFFAAGGYGITQANEWAVEEPRTHTDKNINVARIVSIILCVIGALLVCLTCFLRKQISLAMGCTEETSHAVADMPGLIFFPFLQAAGFICFMIMFLIYAVFIASLGTVKYNEGEFNGVTISYRTFEYDDFVKKAGWYFLFCFFWTSQYIVAIGSLVIAMSVSKWYFTRDKSETSSWTVIQSLCDANYYHQGTAAFGSLIIAIIQLIRSFIGYIQKRAKEADNKFAEGVLCCCQCCFWCFEKCMKFINKNAYIQTAIFGYGFCEGAKEAFFLILRNAARIGAIAYVSQAISIIGRFFITAVTATCSYFLMDKVIGDELYSLIGPVIVIALLAYFVADMFMDVFDMGVSTILQCFIADEEMFDGDECYAQGELKEWIDKFEENDD